MSVELNLTMAEVRVLGSLVEKSFTTPEYYPLTLNALHAACNQKSNRDPVMALGEKDVVRALDGLLQRNLAWSVAMAGSRVPKYRHGVPDALQVSPLQLAVLCELMIRGPQTVAELRGRVERMTPVADAPELDAALQGLLAREGGTLVHRLGRQPGQRGERFAHGLSGAPAAGAVTAEPPLEAARAEVAAEDARIAALEAQVAALQESVAQLQAQFAEFRKQLE